jgi:RNA polymerase sigma-70 factor (ECF subfamily)
MDVDALYQRHRDALLVFLVRRTADTEVALDLWAETFAQAVASSRRYRGKTDAEAAGWLYGIAKRQLAQYYRRGHAEQRALSKLGLERPPASDALLREVEQRAALADLRRDLAEALGTLSEPIRDAVQLRIVDELPYADVARSLRISEPAARARVSRGLAALADFLDPIAIREATAT